MCRSEYRKGFTTCATCEGEVELVEELPKIEELRIEDISMTKPVGFASTSEISRTVEIDGRTIDLMRVYFLPQASEIEMTLREKHIVAVIVPVQVQFPDDHPRFEVRVRNEDHARAEELLREVFASMVANEEGDVVGGVDAESCPACGAHVPLDVEECPECGLNVGGA
jgi:hypothetical protein